jgi:hypothetical protein
MLLAFQRSFYESAVQVLPILILVIAVGELRLRGKRWGFGSFFYVLLTISFMIFGELVAFAVLAGSGDSTFDQVAVVASLLLGCLLLIYKIASLLHDDVLDEVDEVMTGAFALGAALIAIIAVVGGGLVIVLHSG